MGRAYNGEKRARAVKREAWTMWRMRRVRGRHRRQDMGVRGAQAAITEAVTGWAGVTARPHRFGGVEYVIGKREIGHIHGDALVDIPFPKKVRDEVVGAGRAEPHHVLPETGWVSFYLRETEDVARAIALLEESYGIARKQRGE
jgi:hypothetical protein